LLKGGEPDINNVSKSIIMDWQRGNIPYFERPPKSEEEVEAEQVAIAQGKQIIPEVDIMPPKIPQEEEKEDIDEDNE
jgi:ribosome biogenesis GTPase A